MRAFPHDVVSRPVSTYLREIDETPLLSARNEKELAARVGDGDGEARDHLVRANLRLVVNVARGYANRGLPMEDLISEGNLGLLRAAEGFDPGKETRFSTYAVYWIKQSIKRAIINTAPTVRVPAYAAELMTKWRRFTTTLREELGRSPMEEEVAARLGLSAKRLKIVRQALRISGPSPQGTPGDGPGPAETAADAGAGPAAAITGEEESRQVLGLLDRLGERHAAVLRLRFGLSGDPPRTLKEIGAMLGLTRERVRQIEVEGLRELRQRMEAALIARVSLGQRSARRRQLPRVRVIDDEPILPFVAE